MTTFRWPLLLFRKAFEDVFLTALITFTARSLLTVGHIVGKKIEKSRMTPFMFFFFQWVFKNSKQWKCDLCLHQTTSFCIKWTWSEQIDSTHIKKKKNYQYIIKTSICHLARCLNLLGKADRSIPIMTCCCRFLHSTISPVIVCILHHIRHLKLPSNSFPLALTVCHKNTTNCTA